MCTSFQFRIRERDPKNIFFYQRDVENYMDQTRFSVLYYMIDINIYTQNLSVCNSGQYIYMLWVCSLRADWQNQFLFSENSFSEELASYWLLTLFCTFFSMRIRSLHWNALRKLIRRNYGRKSPVSIKYQNLTSFKKGVIPLCQSIF